MNIQGLIDCSNASGYPVCLGKPPIETDCINVDCNFGQIILDANGYVLYVPNVERHSCYMGNMEGKK